jgi:hypothetical protein
MGGVVQNFTKTGYDGECDATAVRSTPPFQRPKERLPRRRRTAARVDARSTVTGHAWPGRPLIHPSTHARGSIMHHRWLAIPASSLRHQWNPKSCSYRACAVDAIGSPD